MASSSTSPRLKPQGRSLPPPQSASPQPPPSASPSPQPPPSSSPQPGVAKRQPQWPRPQPPPASSPKAAASLLLNPRVLNLLPPRAPTICLVVPSNQANLPPPHPFFCPPPTLLFHTVSHPCSVGVLEDDFTCLGILCAILFFPIGLLCCLLLRQRHCPHCGATFS
uniref:Membrane protein BRI3 n=1 Tax=Eptatretus burgeri TaxID=7764 RepID=A0A8C4QE80_EPTBU